MRKFFVLGVLLLAAHVQANTSRVFKAQIGGRVSPAGTPMQADLPGELHLQNKSGKDGSGLCVFTSIEHAATLQGITPLIGFRDYMTKFDGGGYPDKVDKFIAKRCAELKLPIPRYVQVQTKDLEMLKRCTATGRMACGTYCHSPTGRYRGYISHMINVPHADGSWVAVLDNNYPGENRYEWMSPDEYKSAGSCGGNIWFIFFLTHGPPPPLVAASPAPARPNDGKDGGL